MNQRAVTSVLAAARRHASAVFLLAAAAAAIGVLLLTRVAFDANILRLLPQDAPAVRDFETFLDEFGSLDHLYIVFDANDGIAQHGDLVDAYVDALRRAPEIESVDAQLFEPGKDWGYLFDRELYLLGPASAADALARFRPPAIDSELTHARDLLSAPSRDVKAYVQQDPLGLLAVLRDRMGREQGFGAFDPAAQGYVSTDGKSRLVIAKPRGAPFDIDFGKALFARLPSIERDARAAVRPGENVANVEPVRIETAGAYRVSFESEQLIRREGIVDSVGSLVLLLLFVFVLFRTPWVLLYGSLPLAIAAVLALGLGGVLLGRLSPATSGSAGMLFGLGIDGAVLLYFRYLEERETGASSDGAILGMAPTASSVILAQATTAATFFALLLIDFPTLQELGALVGLGILICCASTLLLLPAMLAKGGERRVVRPMLHARWLGRVVPALARPIVVAGAIVTLVLGVAASRLRIDTAIDRLQAQTRGAALERQVAARFSLPEDVLLAIDEGDALEPLVATDARLTDAVARYDRSIAVSGISILLPPADTQAAVAHVIRTTALSPDEAARELRAAGDRIGFRPDAFAPFLQRVPRLLDPGERITYDGLMAHGLGSIVSRFVARRQGRWMTVTYLYPQRPADLRVLAGVVRGVDPRLRLTGVPVVNAEMAARVPPQFLKGVAIGVLAVALLVYAVFRSVRITILALVPTAVGFVWSAGLLALARVELDLFSLFAAVTFIGIVTDYSIYVLYRYAVERTADVGDVLARTAAPIAIACGTALIGFGTLVDSSYRPLRVFGVVSLVTLACCLVASLLLLPALVVSLDRWSESRR